MKFIKRFYLGLVLAFLYIPIVVLIVQSFNAGKSRAKWEGFSFRWYEELFKDPNIMNSLVITLSSTVLTLLLSAMCAFVLVRNKWKACTLLFTMMIASMVIPFQVLMVPLVSFYGGLLNVLNHRLTLILMHTGFSLSMATFLYHGAIHTNIPLELEEAALIDGCTRWQTFWKVVYPLLTPTTATVAIIDAMAFWNDYLLPSLVLTDKSLYTIPIATQVFYGTFSTDIGLILAALLMAMLPILILYVFLQKYIVAGVTSGAVKG